MLSRAAADCILCELRRFVATLNALVGWHPDQVSVYLQISGLLFDRSMPVEFRDEARSLLATLRRHILAYMPDNPAANYVKDQIAKDAFDHRIKSNDPVS